MGAFTARVDLADYLLARAGETTGGNTVIVSTIEQTLTLSQTISPRDIQEGRCSAEITLSTGPKISSCAMMCLLSTRDNTVGLM